MPGVLSAIGNTVSEALSGAGGEMGRRSVEALAGFVYRMRSAAETGGAPDPGASGVDPGFLPVTEAEQRALAAEFGAYARRHPDFARDLVRWARECGWLVPGFIAAVAHTASCPQTLEPVTAAFTDRDFVLATITRLLDEDDKPAGAPVTVLLTGPGGIGKSATAGHCAHQLKNRFPDGQLFMDMAGESGTARRTPSEALVDFLDVLGVRPGNVPVGTQQQAQLFRDCTAGRRLLVVLDDVHEYDQIKPLLPASSGCLVIVTSRSRLDQLVADRGAHPITLGPLSTTDSVRLLTRIAGPERMAGDDRTARALAAQCGGIPLALCTTGARFAMREHLTPQTVLREMSEWAGGPRGEAPFTDGPGPHDVIHRAYEVSYAHLTPQAALLYRMAGTWAWPSITTGPAARVADLPEATTRALLEELAAVHLLEETEEERYRLHDRAREHARTRARTQDGEAALAAAVRRTAAWYLRFAAAADFRVIPSRWHLGPAYRTLALPDGRDPYDARAALKELRQERDNLAAAVRAAAHHRFDDLVWQLCEAMWGLHLRLGFHDQWIEIHRLGLAAARRWADEQPEDQRMVGRMLVQLGFAYMQRGQTDDATTLFQEAAAEDATIGHHRGQATAIECLGLLHLQQNDGPEAERQFREAQRILRRIRPGGDGYEDLPRALALLAHHIGRALRQQRRYADAADLLHEALAQFRAMVQPDLYNEGRVYMSLGETYRDAGDLHRARICLDKAIETMDQEGAELQHADAAELRASCAEDLGYLDDAAEDLYTAATLYEKGGDLVSLARVRIRLARMA
ncbi:tetratricopeptide repeat protein [Streptomyces sp. NPDC050516]|uniref:tetratricopeptide repeat protein n=1 Tax=Streptomyces sp. NPDC050516 TaxID=3365621 RepID=UPI00379D3F86